MRLELVRRSSAPHCSLSKRTLRIGVRRCLWRSHLRLKTPGTVTIVSRDVPPGDNEAGPQSSLQKLARYVEQGDRFICCAGRGMVWTSVYIFCYHDCSEKRTAIHAH